MILVESSRITTDSWEDLSRILRVGNRSSLMQLTETARCVTHLQPARIASETLQLSETVAQLHLAEIQRLGSIISHIQPAPEIEKMKPADSDRFAAHI